MIAIRSDVDYTPEEIMKIISNCAAAEMKEREDDLWESEYSDVHEEAALEVLMIASHFRKDLAARAANPNYKPTQTELRLLEDIYKLDQRSNGM